MRQFYLLGFAVFLLFSCSEQQNDLPSVEERANEAKSELKDKLTAPANGWRLDYQPISGSGSFLILLDFDEDGEVRVQSDVGADDGAYYDQTISYRIDNSQYLELILETYAVFHYLFELEQASFGAEFEFYYAEESDDELVFVSKSDIGIPSIIRLVPANTEDAQLFSREVATNFLNVSGIAPVNFFGLPTIYPSQQLYFSDRDISLFWGIDQARRVLFVDQVVSGATSSGEVIQAIEEVVGYTFLSGAMVLTQPIRLELAGTAYSIDRIELRDFSETGGAPFCPEDLNTNATYTGSVPDFGDFTLSPSLFSSSGLEFVEGSQSSYSVNIPFIFDAEINSLADEGGSIFENFPTASGFLFNFGFESDSLPPYAIGFIVEDEAGVRQLYLREFEVVAHEGNRLQMAFSDVYFLTGTPPADVESKLSFVLDEIFTGGTVYIYYTPFDSVPLFRLYNPCNRYEIFLVG